MVTPETLVDDALIGVSARRIRQLCEQGILERAIPGKFQLDKAVQALIANASGSGSQLQKERIRKLAADANMAELEFAKAKKEVAPIAEMAMVWERRCVIIRQNILNVPQRVVVQLLGETSETVFKRKLREELVPALTEAAHTKVDLDDDEVIDEQCID